MRILPTEHNRLRKHMSIQKGGFVCQLLGYVKNHMYAKCENIISNCFLPVLMS